MKVFENYSLLEHNTFGIDAKCARFVELETVKEAEEFLPTLKVPFLIIGGGSNLLLTQDYKGTVVRSGIKGIEIDATQLRCGSAEVWDEVVDFAVSHNLYGAENLSLIPGDAGASAVQNIGAYGSEAKDFIVEVEAIEIETGKKTTFTNADCEYAYRQSRFKHDWKNKYFITHVTYQFADSFSPKLDYGNIRQALQEKGITEPTAKQLRDTIIEIREAKLPDPKVLGNGGSFFMNPVVERQKFESLLAEYPQMPHYHIDEEHEKIPAGWMIEQCGWKGKSLGRAGVHDKQALVLINRGGATGAEVLTLCNTIRKDVKDKFGIEINPEVNVI